MNQFHSPKLKNLKLNLKMDKKNNNIKIGVLIIMVMAAATSRLLPHPDNFTPIGAMALFGAAYFPKKWMALIVPFLSLWISSVIIDNVFYAQYYEGFQWFSQPFVFLAFALTIGLGWLLLKKVKLSNVFFATLGASAIFFLTTNFGHWLTFVPEKNGATLLATYVAAIPFDLRTLMGNFVYVGIMFSAYEWMKRRIPALQVKKA